MVVCHFLHGQSRTNFTWRFKWATQMHLKYIFSPSSKHHFNTAKAHTAANITREDQMALLKAPLSSSKEIHSSYGCMCQISLLPALASAESSPTDVCTLESVTIILCSCVQDIKQCPLSTEKQIEGTGLTAGLCSQHCLSGRKTGSLMNRPCVHAAATLLENI